LRQPQAALKEFPNLYLDTVHIGAYLNVVQMRRIHRLDREVPKMSAKTIQAIERYADLSTVWFVIGSLAIAASAIFSF
jgi:hypothetical protein